MNTITLILLIYFAALIGITLYFSVRESQLWKTTFIALVISAFGLALWFPGENGYGPGERLKKGLDLAGGTLLVYDVKVPKGRDATTVIDETISILSKRVDPSGTRNLVWRQVAGNRLEVQMPLPDPGTNQRREAFEAAEDAVLKGNIPEFGLDSTLRLAPDLRAESLAKLAGDNEPLLASLTGLAEAYDTLAATSAENDAAQQAYDEAEAAIKALPATASEDDNLKARATADDLRKVLQDKALTYLDAQDAFDELKRGVLAANITATELERIEDLPVPENDGPDVENLRRDAVEKLIAEQPTRKEVLNAWYEAYGAYESKKGQLEDADDLILTLQGSGVLEFRIAPSPDDPGLDVQSYREQLQEQGPRAGRGKPYIWGEIDDIKEFAPDGADMDAVEADPAGFFAQGRSPMAVERYADRYYILLGNYPGLAMTQDEDWALKSANKTRDQYGYLAVSFELNARGAERMLQLTTPNLQKPMAILLDGKAISAPTLQGKIAGNGEITGGVGGFSDAEQSHLVNTLKAGSLEGELSKRPISQKTIGAKFGKDNIDSGYEAAKDALIVVAIFMLAYYFFAGLIADFALVANMILILGVMATLRSTFTLPGIAGIVLTIGMAVDANVLIFERIREEAARGADLATSIRLGYEKALSTILDANITTLITCLVLGYTATVEIKGFAVTLGIGILATLFTALFCTRVFLELYLTYSKARTIPMLPTVIPGISKLLHPKINWVGMRYFFFAFSAVAITIGLTMAYDRGEDLLDIEFRSGTKVSFTFAEGKNLELTEARERLRAFGEVAELLEEDKPIPERLADEAETLKPIIEAANLRYDDAMARVQEAAEDPTVRAIEEPTKVDFTLLINAADSGIITEGQPADPATGTESSEGFGISTLIEDAQAVSSVIKAAFSDVLDTTRPVIFDSIQIEEVNNAPVYPIRNGILGDNIGRSADVRTDVAESVGGVAVVLDNITPPITQADLAQRIERMRRLPNYEGLGHREASVIGLDVADTLEGEPLYSSAVVVTHDSETNYVEAPDTFADYGGLAATEWSLVRDACQSDTSLGSVSNFSSQVSGTMQQQAIVAMSLSLLAVVVYIWFRFGSFTYGFAAIIALVHDVAIALGLVAISAWVYQSFGGILMLEPFKIDLAMVAAFLTIVGYSLNDTIVVFDRIRENRGRLSYATPSVINDSINQTISRTVLTSGTTLLAVGMLYVFGGPGVHGFAFAMLVGVLVGTYSSVAIASPVLMLGGERHVQADTDGTRNPVEEQDTPAVTEK